MLSLLYNARVRRICMLAALALLLAANSFAQSKAQSSAQSTLDLALHYYNSDDLSGRAEQLLKRLLTKEYDNTPQSETAQYYLAAYYQRRFYLTREKLGSPDRDALKQAAVEYRNYTDRYYGGGTHKWLNESFFNLALVHLQLGDPANALNELSKMRKAAENDPSVYIYQFASSSQSQDVIDSSLAAVQLADYATKVIQGNGANFEKAVLMIQKWSQGQRVKASQSAN